MRTRLATLVLAAATPLLAVALSPAASGATIEEVRKLDPGGRFVLDSDLGSVTLVGAASSGARITITSERVDLKANYNVTIEESPGLVRVTVKKRGILGGWWQRGSVHFDVQVPERTEVEVETGGGRIDLSSIDGDTRLGTSGGAIHVSHLRGKLEAETSGGAISVEKVEGDANVRTSGGPIEVASVTGSLEAETSGGSLILKDVAGALHATTSGGRIQIEGAGGTVIAKTSGGGIEARFAAGNARGGEIETSGGGIRVVLDSAVDLTLDAASSGGSVTTAIPVAGQTGSGRSSLRGTIGRGGETLRLRTSGGSIHIERP